MKNAVHSNRKGDSLSIIFEKGQGLTNPSDCMHASCQVGGGEMV